MRRLMCSLVALVTFATSAATVTAVTAETARAASASAPTVPQLVWSDCGDGFQCAVAKVPLDYDAPHGATIALSLKRLPATDPSRRIGSLFLNPGGPGGSGVEFVQDQAQYLFSNEVRARFDLVGFDPRGIRRSTPLRCFGSLDEVGAALAPFPFPYTRNQESVFGHSDQLIRNACAQNAGPVLDHMSTANVARDLDLLRQAVGDSQLTYYGISYGTYLGETYANLFPGRVRSLVLDGVVDPIGWATGRGDEARTLPAFIRLHNDASEQQVLEQFFRLCDEGGANCAFSGNSETRFRNLAQRVLESPVTLINGVVIGYPEMIDFTLDVLYWPNLWPLLAKSLARLERRSNRVEVAAATAAVTELQTALAQARGADKYQNFIEGQPGVICTDTANPSSLDAFSSAARASDKKYGYFGRPWAWLTSICSHWPGVDRDRFTGPFTQHTANPILLISNTYDPATPYQGAVTTAKLLPGSRLLTLDGWGHTAMFLSGCIDHNRDRYLLTGVLPPKGTVCRPDEVPFAAPAAGSA